MTSRKKFESFLESLKGKGQDVLIESVKKGFQVCFESENVEFDESLVDEEVYYTNTPSSSAYYGEKKYHGKLTGKYGKVGGKYQLQVKFPNKPPSYVLLSMLKYTLDDKPIYGFD